MVEHELIYHFHELYIKDPEKLAVSFKSFKI